MTTFAIQLSEILMENVLENYSIAPLAEAITVDYRNLAKSSDINKVSGKATEVVPAKSTGQPVSDPVFKMKVYQSTDKSDNYEAGKQVCYRQGLLFYHDAGRGPLQGNFAEMEVDPALNIWGNMARLNPACNTGVLLYLVKVKLPKIENPATFRNEFMSVNRTGGMISVTDTIGVVAVRLSFDVAEYYGTGGSEILENPIIYKGKTYLGHSIDKPREWGSLSNIELIPLNNK